MSLLHLPATELVMKRGSEELLSHSQMVTNGNSLSASPTATLLDLNHDAKKVKLSDYQPNNPSRVLHFRSVPSDASEGEVIQLGLPFGKMTNLVLAKKKNQALLEMADVTTAQTMVQYYTEHPPCIRGRTVYVQFSNHPELKTEQSNQQNAGAQAALQAAQQLIGSGSLEDPKIVLRVIVENMLYPVSIDVLKQIFTRFGQVLKIVTFNKNNTFQALIQYSDPIAAQSAKATLSGQNIYNGCCTLRIDFSKLPSLNVKYNNDKSRDYTNPTLPTGETAIPMDTSALSGFGSAHSVFASPFATAIPGFGTTLTYGAASPSTVGLGALTGDGHQAGNFSLGLGMNPAASPMSALGQRMSLPSTMSGGAVLLISNLNENKVTPDALFTLFGVYGDVHRVKIMFNKKDNALIQFADPGMAQTALMHLDKVKLWGKIIKVAPSKHAVVQMPKDGQPDAGLTKDFSSSPLHRFKKPNSKNHHNIFPPSATLHLSNIPSTVEEEALKEAFAEHGEIVAFKFFQKDRKMALIQMGSVEEACHALMELHNHELDNTQHLRVSFTKSSI